MAEFKDYTNLEVWLGARDLANSIYRGTRKFPKEEMYGLSNQMRRSAVSIPSNIAEGIGRSSSKETVHFLEIAKGSLFELETQLYISFDQSFVLKGEFDEILAKINYGKRLIYGFIKYQKIKESDSSNHSPLSPNL